MAGRKLNYYFPKKYFLLGLALVVAREDFSLSRPG